MSTPMIPYGRDHRDPMDLNWYAPGYPTIVIGGGPVDPDPDPTDPTMPRPPREYDSLGDAIDDMDLPTNADYREWTPANGHDIAAWARTLPSTAVMVIPKSYGPSVEFDSSKGFRASDTIAMEYISDADYLTKGLASDGKPYGTKYVTGMVPVEPTAGHWFSMMRVPRGIVTLGGQELIPTDSGYKGQRQPKSSMGVYDQRDTQTPRRLFLHVGVQHKLIETSHASPIYANFTLRRRDFGTIAHSGLAAGAAGGVSTIRRVHLDKCWSGFAGIPNGEAGGLSASGSYDWEDVLLSTDEAYSSSPIMWNRSEGGSAKRVRVGKHRIGMITFWRSGGVNTFEDVTTYAGSVGINLEEDLASFILNWESGLMSTDATALTKHLNINPLYGSIQVHLGAGFTATLNSGYGGTGGKLVSHAYGPVGVQRRAHLTWDAGEIAYIPSGNYIA